MAHKEKLPKNVTSFVDRHGKRRYRYRKTGEQTRYFDNHPNSKEGLAELEQFRTGNPPPVGAERVVPGSIDDLMMRWYRSADFANASEYTRHKTRLITERFRAEFGKDLVKNFTFEHIESILVRTATKRMDGGRQVGGPEAASRLRLNLQRMFTLAVRLGWIQTNPVELAKRLTKPKSDGFHTWTDEEIAQFQRRHPIGTKPRLALEIMLWTAQRGSDARLFGPAQMRNGKINYSQVKTGKALWLPAAPQLLEAIRAMPAVGVSSYLVSEHGKPFSPKGFGNWFRDRCDEADLQHCSAHGLRKAAARRAAQLGGTNQGLKAVGGWSNDREVATYTAAVEQEALAEVTLGRVIEWDLANREGSDLANPDKNG